MDPSISGPEVRPPPYPSDMPALYEMGQTLL